ncbi:MAG TPA: thiamine diphosphokinase [Anaerolineaceae bacterium]|nr:thiamine diphosphokinase [Anaerolineaceae bacterium]HPN51952.1 thiamine diphosphokinase [Anaerolineaceae bacterium]
MSEFKRAVIFVNGELRRPKAVKASLTPADFLISADGGLRHLTALGLTPHLLVGDLDSADAPTVARLQVAGVSVQRHPREKDATDLELALQAALAQGLRDLLLVAALGGRLDQTLGNLALLSLPELAGCTVLLDDGEEEVRLIRAQAVIHGQAGETLSLLPWQGLAEGVTTEGLRYPLFAETLYPERTRGISNELLAETARVSLKRGQLLCIRRRIFTSNCH